MAKKIFHWIHLWLSVPFGLIITLICFSGAMLVFENEITAMLRKDLVKVSREGAAADGGQATAVPLDRLAESVSGTLDEGVEVTGVTVYADPDQAWKVNLSKPRRASVYVDQYTGEVKGRSERPGFFAFMFRMHRWLLDSMKPDENVFWGKIVVGVSTLAFVLVLLSGVVIWWRRSLKALKNRLKISVGKGWTPFWYSLHLAGGMYVCIFLLAMALTGLTWSFGWYRTGFYKLFGAAQTTAVHSSSQAGKQDASRDGQKKDASGERNSRGNRPEADFSAWQKVYLALAQENPDYKSITVSKGSATVSMDRLGNRRASDKYTFDQRTGEITGVEMYKDSSDSSRLRGWIYSVHVGSWGGILTRILAFISALVGAALPLTGYWMWLRRICRPKPAHGSVRR